MFSEPEKPTLPTAPENAVTPPIFGMQQAKKKPKAKSQTPTAITPEMVANPANTGQKTLVGQ